MPRDRGFFTYIGGSAFVLQTTYGMTQTQYAVLFATNAAAMVVASIGFRALVDRVGPAPLRTVGVTTATAASLGLVALALTSPGPGSSVAVPWLLLCLVVAGMGLSIPGTMALLVGGSFLAASGWLLASGSARA